MSPRRTPASLSVTPLEGRSLPAAFYPTLYTNEQVNLQTDYTGNAWDVSYTNVTSVLGSSTLADSAFYLPSAAKVTVPSTTAFSFLGTGSTHQAYVLPQTQNAALPYLGVSTTGTATGTLTAYNPNDARVTNLYPSSALQPWVRVNVTAVRGPGNVSVYQTNSAGVPTNWVASGDGISAKDALYVVAGTTQQYNWAFTAPGVYQVDVTATGYRGANQTLPITSATQTMSFAVDVPGPTNSVPASGATSTGGKPIIFTSGGNSLSVAGPVLAPAPVETTLTVQHGSLALGATTDVGTVSGNTTGSVTVTGTIAQVNVAINGVVYMPTPGYNGVDNFTLTTSDRGAYRPATVNEQTDTDSFGILVTGNPAAGSGGGTSPPVVVPPTYPVGSAQALPRYEAIGAAVGAPGTVSVVDADTRSTLTTFTPYEAAFTGGVRVAVADLRKTGVPEIITAPASGGAARIQVFDRLGSPARLNFFAFDPSFTGGVTLATADVNNDGYPDILVGAGPGGGPRVSAFDGRTGVAIRSFFAFEAGFRGGVSVAAGDVTGDGYTDIVVGAGPGGGPAVAVFDGANPILVRRFFAYAPTFRGGVNVAVGNVTGNAAAEIIVGAGAGGGPHVQVFDGMTLAPLASFFATPPTAQTTSGVEVSVADLQRDLMPEIVTVTPGALTDPATLRTFDLSTNTYRPQGTDLGLNDAFNGAVFIAGVV